MQFASCQSNSSIETRQLELYADVAKFMMPSPPRFIVRPISDAWEQSISVDGDAKVRRQVDIDNVLSFPFLFFSGYCSSFGALASQ